MNYFDIVKTYSKYRFIIIFMLLTGLLLNSCTEEPQLRGKKSVELVASEYMVSHAEFSEFSKLIEVTGFGPLLSIRGPYTILLPNNDAMFAYYKEKNVKSLMDFDKAFQKKLALNHLISNEISTEDMGLGAIRDTNAIGDYLVTEFRGSDIVLNRHSKIIGRNVRLANGYAHIIDHVIDPITKDVFTVLSEDPSYSIFAEGLRISGLQDTLQQLTFPYGKRKLRNRYTLLAVPDSIYIRKGIPNADALIKWTGANPDSLTFRNNAFYRYMEYHCISGTYYLNTFNNSLYPILSSDNHVLITIDTDYKINFNYKTKSYTSFIIPASNTPSKNGTIHAITDLLPVIQPEPQTVLFETTNFLEIREGDFFGKYYMKWNDGQNSLEKIKFEGDFLGYYYKNHDIPLPLINYDALFMLGFWWIEVTFPKVMKGKYQIVYGSPWTGSAGISSFQVYLDGKMTPYLYDGSRGGNQVVAVAEFTTTSEHKIKIVPTIFGALYWDFVQFVPVK